MAEDLPGEPDCEKLAEQLAIANAQTAATRRELAAARDTIVRLKAELCEAQRALRGGATATGGESATRGRTDAEEYRLARQRRQRGAAWR